MPVRKAHPHIIAGVRDRLRQLLAERDWTAADLQSRLKGVGVLVAHPTVRAWVSGKGALPDAYVLLLICRTFGVDWEWLLTGEGSRAMRARPNESTEAAGGLELLRRFEEFADGERTRLTGGSRDVGGGAGRAIAAALPGAGGAQPRRPAAGA